MEFQNNFMDSLQLFDNSSLLDRETVNQNKKVYLSQWMLNIQIESWFILYYLTPLNFRCLAKKSELFN